MGLFNPPDRGDTNGKLLAGFLITYFSGGGLSISYVYGFYTITNDESSCYYDLSDEELLLSIRGIG